MGDRKKSKKSVLHNRLEKIGGVFGQSAGWERVNWFADSDQKAEYKYDFFLNKIGSKIIEKSTKPFESMWGFSTNHPLVNF